MKISSTSSNLKKEIIVIQKIIEQLQECLVIYHQQNYYVDFKNTLKDIGICKKELKRLNAELNMKTVEDQGETVNDAEDERHRKNVL
jgi:hypothetical protein